MEAANDAEEEVASLVHIHTGWFHAYLQYPADHVPSGLGCQQSDWYVYLLLSTISTTVDICLRLALQRLLYPLVSGQSSNAALE